MKCYDEKCEKEALYGLRIVLNYDDGGEPDIACVKLPVCEEHKFDHETTKHLVEENWEYFCLGAEQGGRARPVFDLTGWEWAPVQEIEDFFNEAVNQVKTLHRN